jgi:hypothetical protein
MRPPPKGNASGATEASEADHDNLFPAKNSIRRRGRGKSRKNIELIDAACRILEEIQPATVRAVCYRLFVEKLIPSMDTKHTQRVSVQLTDAREAGTIPWAWVVDETRRPECIATWDSPEARFESAVLTYRKDYWQDQDEWLEVWSEKGTVRGTLEPVLDKYGVTFRVFHGFNSSTVMHDIAEMTTYNYKRLTVLYVGDFDPSGLCMSVIDIPKRLERYGGSAEVLRLAIAPQDITPEANLPGFPVTDKTKDPRYKWFRDHYGEKCWELDALSPVILRDRVEAAIRDRLDLDAWEHATKIEAVERETMEKYVCSYGKSISEPVQKYSKRSRLGRRWARPTDAAS